MSFAPLVRGPMMGGHRSSASLEFSRMQALKKILSMTAESMGSSSPEKVLQNFIGLLQSASPQLKLAILFFTPWAMLITAVSKYGLIRRTFASLKDYALSTIYASISIPSTHPLNKQVLAYFVEHGLGKNARTLALTSPGATGNRVTSLLDEFPYLYGSDGRRSRSKRNLNAEEDDRQRAALSYIPEVGKYRFWWKGFPMTFDRQRGLTEQIDSKGRVSYLSQLSGSETIVISCPSFIAGTRPIQDFLNHVKTIPGKDNTTTIYRPDGANSVWDNGITRPSRNLNAVTLDANVKDDLVKDIETYLSPQTRKYYANRGIPWRRGFLFYGNPGTGKTSFTNALAGHLNLNIYMISLSNNILTDAMLETLFEQLPSKCIVLLEDIDSAGIQREDMRQQMVKQARKNSRKYGHQYLDADGNPMSPDMYARRMAGGVTLSGLLNVLDGIHSKEGHVTIMTSNSPDSLDPALVRPGRIDRKVLFGYASEEVIKKLFVHIFSKAPEELLAGEKAETDGEGLAELGKEFARIVPADKLTPAEVQGFLLVHREDPVDAVAQATAWVEKTLATKEKGTNVEAFAGQEETKGKDDKRERKSTPKEKKIDKEKAKGSEDSSAGAHEPLDADDEDVDAETASSSSSASCTTEDYSTENTSPPSSRPASEHGDVENSPAATTATSVFSAQPSSTSQSIFFSNQAAAQDIRQFLETAGIVVPITAPVSLPTPSPPPISDAGPAASERIADDADDGTEVGTVKKKAKTRSKRK